MVNYEPADKMVCPECGHVFQGNGWAGIDAHWRSKHEEVMPFEEAWPLLRYGEYTSQGKKEIKGSVTLENKNYPRVVAIDPAPAKPSTVFDGTCFTHMPAPELRDYLKRISHEPGTLVCWDAPLTGPADVVRAGSTRYDFTKRPIERFFSSKQTGFKAPTGISVLGYAACPHWTITRSLLGLPRVGAFDAPDSRLPFGLVTQMGDLDAGRPSVVEIHPALAAWLWCRHDRPEGASWSYKGSTDPERERRVRTEMWDIIRKRADVAADLPQPETDDEFDAAVGFVLGAMLMRDQAHASGRCTILGNARDGAWLVPCVPKLVATWDRWPD